MKKYLLLSSLLCVLCCTKPEPVRPSFFPDMMDGDEITLNLRLSETPYGGELALGEDCSVIYGTSANRLPAVSSGVFAGPIKFSESAQENGRLLISYPYLGGTRSSDGKTLSVNLAQTQDCKGGNCDPAQFVQAAAANIFSAQLDNIFGALKFTLEHEGISKVAVSASGSDYISGRVEVSFETGHPVVASCSAVANMVEIKTSAGVMRAGEAYYIAVNPGAYQSLSLKFTCEGKTYTAKLAESVTVEAGVATDLGVIDAGLDITTSNHYLNGSKVAADMTLAGVVRNASTGLGIAGVPVSDGYSVVKTDGNGVYQMKANALCRCVNMNVPAGYAIPMNGTTHLPQFYALVSPVAGTLTRQDFSLEPLSEPEDEVSIMIIADPQSSIQTWADKYRDRIVADIQTTLRRNRPAKYKNTYSFTVGDIVYENDAMWDVMAGLDGSVDLGDGSYLPMFHVVGNHDQSVTGSASDYDATRFFVNHFGPTEYSFDRGNVHVVAVDDVIATTIQTNEVGGTTYPNGGKWLFDGGLTDEKLEWLRQDLACVENKAEKAVVLCLHIPFRDSPSKIANMNPVISLLCEFGEAHIMAGHTHKHNITQYGKYSTKGGNGLVEHIHGAAFGYFWAFGHSCEDGVPEGYYIYTFKNGKSTSWDFKAGNGRDDDYQIRVYDGDQEYTGKKEAAFHWYQDDTWAGYSYKGFAPARNSFVVETFNYDGNWSVELWQNGSKVGNFTNIPADYCTLKPFNAFVWNEKYASGNPAIYSRPNLWYYTPKGVLPSEMSGWEVRAIHKVPGSDVERVYTRSDFTRDFSEF